MRSAPLLLLLLLSMHGATAQTVQKCVDRAGQARYQSDPCRAGEKTAETWDATPDEAPSPPRPSSRARRYAATPTRRRASVGAVAAANVPDACERARAWRDAAERRAGLARNYDFLSALDRRVFDACR